MNIKRKSIIWRDFMLRTCGVRKSRGAYRHMLVEAVVIRLSIILQYSSDISEPIQLRLFNIAIFAVVPDPMNGSYTKSPSLLHEMIWSFARRSGNTAGCPVFPPPTVYSNILNRFLLGETFRMS